MLIWIHMDAKLYYQRRASLQILLSGPRLSTVSKAPLLCQSVRQIPGDNANSQDIPAAPSGGKLSIDT